MARGRRTSVAGVATPDYTGQFPGSPVDVIINDHVVGDLPAQALLGGAQSQAALHAGLVVTAGAKAGLLDVTPGRHDQRQDGMRVAAFDLLGTVQFDFQYHVRAGNRAGVRRAGVRRA